MRELWDRIMESFWRFMYFGNNRNKVSKICTTCGNRPRRATNWMAEEFAAAECEYRELLESARPTVVAGWDKRR